MPAPDIEIRFKQTGRNDDCPCGSGKKYKKCHLREDEEAVSKILAVRVAEAAEAAKAEGADGHVHGPDCEHEESEMQARPKAAPKISAAAPKTPMSHKPVSTPRKAV